MTSLGLQEAYELLSHPSRTVSVLDYVSNRPHVQATTARRELHLDLRTWYSAVAQLESLGFVTVERVPGGKKALIFRLTPSGKIAHEHLRGLAPLVENSRAALEWSLSEGRTARGSAGAGESLTRLIELAERRADFAELETLAGLAEGWGRPGEAQLAAAVRSFLKGDSTAARDSSVRSMDELSKERTARSYLKALHTYAAALEYTGNSARAFESFTQLRTLAHAAGEGGMEAEGWLGTGILKARRAQFRDAADHIARGLDCARPAGQLAKEAKLLANLCYVQLFFDLALALRTSDEAMRVARTCGATLIVGRIQLNRALIFALQGASQRALEALGEARALLRAGGEEHGAAALEDWAREVRRIARMKVRPDPSAWQARIIALSNARPGEVTKQGQPPEPLPGGAPR